tara:strand:- start:247 stop:486 length:240 start_codon:yes stop_codon:yes gene_type:complete
MNPQTFHITHSRKHPKPFNYVFSWHDGTKETFIVMSLHGVVALAEHFYSLGYDDLADHVPNYHGQVRVNYKRAGHGIKK